ncbi:MAG: GntR family transcriptional regulator [Ignavibacterium sp.]|nr:GntR family transcriptional regulator [Ignavibacterium sp.]
MIEKEPINVSFNLEELKPLRDKIASSIRDSIIEGRIKPGERLMEPDIAKALGVSRTPLREAFLQLESEGFLKVNPRKGALVTETSLKDAKETYEIKGALEALAARLAADNIKDDQIGEIIDINKKMASIAQSKKKDYKAFLELNSIFHQKIYECSGNLKLSRMINTLRNQTLRYNYIYLSLLSHLDESVLEHFEIVNALKNRKPDEAEAVVKKHNESARKMLINYIKNQKE